MSCWALWQRLPPRFQLSTREPEPSQDAGFTTPLSPISRSPRAPLSAGASPRVARDDLNKSYNTSTKFDLKEPHLHREVLCKQSYSSSQGHKESSKQAKSYPSRGKGVATMFFTVQTSPREASPAPAPHCPTAFPSRSSSFLTSFKQQQRINSARQNFVDPSVTPTASPRRSKSRDAKALAAGTQFPVTRIDTTSNSNDESTSQNKDRHRSTKNTSKSSGNFEESSYRPQSSPKHAVDRSSRLSVNTLLPAQEVKPFFKNPLYSEAHNVRYVFKAPQNSSLVIDNDRVLVVKPHRSNAKSAPPSRENSASYLAHLRRLYLKDPKDFAKTNTSHASGSTKRKVFYERLEYEKRTDSILNYYSRADDVEIANAWASAIELSRRPNTTPSTRASKRREGARTCRSQRSPPRPTSARTRPNSARFPFELADPVPCTNSPRDALGDWDEFLKINTRSALHERQFYLRTPALGRHGVTHETTEIPQQQDDRACRMCQLESKGIIEDGYELANLPKTHEKSVPGSQDGDFWQELENGLQEQEIFSKKISLSGGNKINKKEVIEKSNSGRNENVNTQTENSQCVTVGREMRIDMISILTKEEGPETILTKGNNNDEIQTSLKTESNAIGSEKRHSNGKKSNNGEESLKLEQSEMCCKAQNKLSHQSSNGIECRASSKTGDADANDKDSSTMTNHIKNNRDVLKPTNFTKSSMEIHVPFQGLNDSTEVGAEINKSPQVTLERNINPLTLNDNSDRLTLQTMPSPDSLDVLGKLCKSDLDAEVGNKTLGCELSKVANLCDVSIDQGENKPEEVHVLHTAKPESMPVKEVVMDVKTGDFYVKLEANDTNCSDTTLEKRNTP